jgi:hypothetical protein
VTALTCDGCGAAGRGYRNGLCKPCVLDADLRAVLDGGTGGIRPELLPFFGCRQADIDAWCADGYTRRRNTPSCAGP